MAGIVTTPVQRTPRDEANSEETKTHILKESDFKSSQHRCVTACGRAHQHATLKSEAAPIKVQQVRPRTYITSGKYSAENARLNARSHANWEVLFKDMLEVKNPRLRGICPFLLMRVGCPDVTKCRQHFIPPCLCFVDDGKPLPKVCKRAHFRRVCWTSFHRKLECSYVRCAKPGSMALPVHNENFVHYGENGCEDYVTIYNAVMRFSTKIAK